MNNDTEMIIKLIQMAVILMIASIFIYRTKVKGVRGYFYLILSLVSGLLQGIIELIFYLLRDIFDPASSMVPRIENIPYALVLLFLLMHFEYFMGWKPIATNFGILMIIVSMTAYFIDLAVGIPPISVNPNLSVDPINDKLFMWIFDLYQLYILVVCAVASGIIFFKTMQNKNQKSGKTFNIKSLYNFFKSPSRIATFLVWFSLLIALFVGITEMLEHFLIEGFYGAIGYGIAMLIVLLTFTVYRNFVYVTPIPVHYFLVIHHTGATIFSIQNLLGHNKTDDVQIGGIINAFTSVMNDITGEPNQILKCVELEKRAVLAQKKKDIIGILIADKKIRILENSLSKFLDEFYKKFKREIENFSGNTSAFDSAIDLLPKLFPYLEREYLVLPDFDTPIK